MKVRHQMRLRVASRRRVLGLDSQPGNTPPVSRHKRTAPLLQALDERDVKVRLVIGDSGDQGEQEQIDQHDAAVLDRAPERLCHE